MRLKPVVRSKMAEADLGEIWQYIALESVKAADGLLDELERRGNDLAHHPHIVRLRPEIGPGVRILAIGNYLLLYRVGAQEIEIMRYIHGKRDLGHI